MLRIQPLLTPSLNWYNHSIHHFYHLQSLRLPPHVPWPNLLLTLWGVWVQWLLYPMFLLLWNATPTICEWESKGRFIISLLSGRALQWARSIWDSQSPITRSLDAFVTNFKEVFGTTALAISVHDKLFQLRQADMSIHDYTVGFRTLATTSGWNETALLSAFRHGLNPSLRKQMAIYEEKVGLENFLQKALHVSQYLTACHSEESSPPAASPATVSPAPEPRQMDRYHLSKMERPRRVRQQLFLYCGADDRLLPAYPVCPSCPTVSTVHINPNVLNLPHIDFLLIHSNNSFPAKVLIDSGSSCNFISSRFLVQVHLPWHRMLLDIKSPPSRENRWERAWCVMPPRGADFLSGAGGVNGRYRHGGVH